MVVVVSCSVLALLLTYLESAGKMENGMRWGFLLITFLACIHYDYGNDYMSYYLIFREVEATPFDIGAVLDGYAFREPGWALICYLFQPLGGFFVMVAVLSVIQNAIVYKFIRDNVEPNWRTFSVFIYLFTTNLYLMNFSMMRQGLVICVFLGLWQYIQEKKWWIPLSVLVLCTFVHSSAIILLPFAFWGYVRFNNTKIIGIVLMGLYFALWFSGDFLNMVFMSTMSIEDVQEYVDTYEKGDATSQFGVGFFLYQLPFFATVYYLCANKNSDDGMWKLVSLAAIATLITPFSQIIQLIGRVAIYFSIYTMASMPLVYANITKRTIRVALLLENVALVLYDYYLFFNNPVWVDKFSEFHTVFEVL